MNPIYQTSAQLKERARHQMEGKFGVAIGMMVIVQLISYIITMIVNSLIPARTLPLYILQLAAGFITSAFIGVSKAGITLFHLNIACNRPYSFRDLLYGYQNHLEKTLILALVDTGVIFVYQQIISLPLTLFNATYDMKYLGLFYLLMIPAIALFTYFSLLFSQIFYVLLDFPSYSAGEVIRTGIRIMKGHKGRLLYITLSFIPLMLLSFLTCGIGMLWLIPYMNMTMTNFYLDLMNPQNASPYGSQAI